MYRLDADDTLATALKRRLGPRTYDAFVPLLARPHVEAKLVEPGRARIRRSEPTLDLAATLVPGARYTFVARTTTQRAFAVRLDALDVPPNDGDPASGYIDFTIVRRFETFDVAGEFARVTAPPDME